MLYRRVQSCTSTSATAGSRQRRVSTSGSSVSGTPISGSRGRHQPCVLHVGPVVTERLQLAMASCRRLILGRRWPNTSNKQPHTLVAYYLPRSSSPTGAHGALARCMQMQAAQHMVVRCRCVAEPALRMWHALRLCAWPICARRGTRHNGFVNYRQGLHETTQDGWDVVPVDCSSSICDPHDVQHHTSCRYWTVHQSAGSGREK